MGWIFCGFFGGSSELEFLRNQNEHLPAGVQGLPGVNQAPYPGTPEEKAGALESAKILVERGVEFAHCEPGRVP